MDKKELMIDFNELEAYRSLNGVPFDFGNGLVTDDSEESEDVYWKMSQQDIEDCIEEFEESPQPKTRKKGRPNRYERKYAGRKRLQKIPREVWWIVGFDKEKMLYKRYYESGRKGFAKKQTNRKIRHTKDFATDGGGYRKLFDYWGSVF